MAGPMITWDDNPSRAGCTGCDWVFHTRNWQKAEVAYRLHLAEAHGIQPTLGRKKKGRLKDAHIVE